MHFHLVTFQSIYRATHHVDSNLLLTSKHEFRFGLAWPYQNMTLQFQLIGRVMSVPERLSSIHFSKASSCSPLKYSVHPPTWPFRKNLSAICSAPPSFPKFLDVSRMLSMVVLLQSAFTSSSLRSLPRNFPTDLRDFHL